MFDTLNDLSTALEHALAELDPDTLEGSDAVVLLEHFDQVARLAGAGRAICAARIDATGAWRKTGHRDAPGFVAARTGSHRSDAKDAIAIGNRLGGASRFGAAVRSGTISPAQAAEIADTLAERPDAEDELLGAAQTATMRELRAACAEIASRGTGADERHARASEHRYCSSGVGRDGQWRLNAGLTATDGAIVDKVLEYFQNEAFDDARTEGRREPFTAYRADALVRMAKAAMARGVDHRRDGTLSDESGPGTPRRRRRRGRPRSRSSSIRHTIVVTVPHTTFLPGTPTEGETCRIPGVGPVPVAQVQKLLEDDPIIKCIVTRGRDITATATMTRTIKDDLRLAVLHAHDYVCAVPTCTNTRFVELDHEMQFTDGGPTDYQNLRPLCSYHHDQRSNEKYELVGQPGAYRWIGPDGSMLLADPGACIVPDPPPTTDAPHPVDPDVTSTAEHSPDALPAPA
jgi:hypothetical protein